jgi:hypothetical protein
MRVFAEMYLWRAIGIAGASAIIELGTITTHVWKWVGAKKPLSASVLARDRRHRRLRSGDADRARDRRRMPSQWAYRAAGSSRHG